MKKTAVIAIGGNSLIKPGQKGSVNDQFNAVQETVDNIMNIINLGYDVVITHGNGPQIGNVLIQSESAKELVPSLPMDYCGAFTQGGMGYMIQQSLQNAITERKLNKNVATIISQVVVDQNDPAFKTPTKPVGPFYKSVKEIEDRINKEGWIVKEDAGRGYRRVVPSPKPVEILELESIKHLINQGTLVVSVGGGGIPVIKNGKGLQGIAAVIDKDFASSLLASKLGADLFIISTGVPKVAINYNKENQKWLDDLSLNQCKDLKDQGHFAPGSMLPKIEASVKFLQNGGKEVIITSPDKLFAAVKGETGTHILKNIN